MNNNEARERVQESFSLKKAPWQLSEDMYEGLEAGSSYMVAEAGLTALALEHLTKFDDKALEYAEVWQIADEFLNRLELDNRGQIL